MHKPSNWPADWRLEKTAEGYQARQLTSGETVALICRDPLGGWKCGTGNRWYGVDTLNEALRLIADSARRR